jgi:Rieske Fe-S protein
MTRPAANAGAGAAHEVRIMNRTAHLDAIADGQAKATQFDRRTFLDALLSVGFVSTAAAIAYPVAQYLVPPAAGEPETSSVVAGKVGDLRPNSAKVFKFGNRPGIAVRTAEGDVRAFSAVCTHLDCTVQFKADTSVLWCACHNGTYDLGGNVVSGPPPRSLEKFVVNLRGEGADAEIVVSRA